jgi:hypothetical protein
LFLASSSYCSWDVNITHDAYCETSGKSKVYFSLNGFQNSNEDRCLSLAWMVQRVQYSIQFLLMQSHAHTFMDSADGENMINSGKDLTF